MTWMLKPPKKSLVAVQLLKLKNNGAKPFLYINKPFANSQKTDRYRHVDPWHAFTMMFNVATPTAASSKPSTQPMGTKQLAFTVKFC